MREKKVFGGIKNYVIGFMYYFKTNLRECKKSEKCGERIPTRCNNIDVYFQFRCLILTTASTCFGHLYAHHQEKKTTCYCIWGCLLVVLDVAGCGTVVLRCRV